ncbi:MAG: MmcQ/YjbR family DNA-binding protein [Clostridiales bacterium]|nr:MmcQ/YjbR family DNA-binding protein [Clostridiales bacterium]
MTREDFLAFCEGLEGAVCDQPFMPGDGTFVARHERSRKWFAVLMNLEGRDFVNLKAEPGQAALMRSLFTGVRPGYHMNKDHWISVDLMGDVPDEIIQNLTRDSHALTAPALKRVKAHRDLP